MKKRKLFFIVLIILLLTGCEFLFLKKEENNKNTEKKENINNKKNTIKYGVFLGINEEESYKLNNYDIVVIDPSEFSSQKIKELKAKNKKVYGYLNIGPIEEYRPYFSKFKDLFLGTLKIGPMKSGLMHIIKDGKTLLLMS